jgi:putative salt-induced outer membrane protein YdiY
MGMRTVLGERAIGGAAWAAAVLVLCPLRTTSAQEPEPGSAVTSGDDVVSEPPAGVTEEGVPAEATDASSAAAEVGEAIEQVKEEAAEGLPPTYTIEFGDTHDWMRLTSGEWLKGNIERMRDDEIEFDSDKLDLVKLKWHKVDELHSPQINTYVFEGKVDIIGRAVVTKDTVLIETEDGVQSYPRSDLLSILEGGERELNWWSTKLGAGFSANAGNTNQGSLTAYFQVMRADYRTRSRARYDGTVGYANSDVNVNRHIGAVDVTVYFSKRWYFTPAAAQFLNDHFQNLRFRATPGAAAGVHLFDTKKVEWDIEAGLGYQYTNFLSTQAGIESKQNDGFASLGTWAEFEFVDDVELELEWRTNFVYTRFQLTNHTARARFSVEITDIFEFETSFIFLRTEKPPPREDGSVPESNDYQLIVGVALKLG